MTRNASCASERIARITAAQMSKQVTLRAVVLGVVQGVGYRMFASRQARLRGLAGQVKNLPDGSVEVVGVGEKETLALLVEDLRRGPLGGRVDEVECEWLDGAKEYSGFEIRY